MNFKPFEGKIKNVSVSSYYTAENAIKTLPIIQALIESGGPLLIEYGNTGRTGVYQLINAGWHYLEDNGPVIQELQGQKINWQGISNSRKNYKLTMTEAGLVISSRIERKLVSRISPESKVVKVNWEYELTTFLEKEDPSYPFVIKDLQLSQKDEEKAHKLLLGLGYIEYQVTPEMIVLKGTK